MVDVKKITMTVTELLAFIPTLAPIVGSIKVAGETVIALFKAHNAEADHAQLVKNVAEATAILEEIQARKAEADAK